MEEKYKLERPLGFLGDLLIEERMKVLGFDDAYDEWKRLEKLIEFMIKNPNIVDYNKYDEFRKERRREFRKLVKKWFGDHMKSADVDAISYLYSLFNRMGLLQNPSFRCDTETLRHILVSDLGNDENLVYSFEETDMEGLKNDFLLYVRQHDLTQLPIKTALKLFIRSYKS
ncbi:hypothetical protein Pla110_45510 [Polystyrenella longa]|uniref:Uncharacterized protein n=1 Tax=Polystyrenella longa TaxID=2528007 RepID=A0A518CU78_9PLAN|nr:hypothetical protein [Polystyrenella longa]QDU82789.1 hypothetical protein Pla110_45510 [Polystyrenella longa]